MRDVQDREQLAEPPRNGRFGDAFEQQRLPGRQPSGASSITSTHALAVEVDQRRDAPGRELCHQLERSRLVERSLRRNEPLVGDPEPLERLLDDDALAFSANGEDDAGDAACQLDDLETLHVAGTPRAARGRGRPYRASAKRQWLHLTIGRRQ